MFELKRRHFETDDVLGLEDAQRRLRFRQRHRELFGDCGERVGPLAKGCKGACVGAGERRRAEVAAESDGRRVGLAGDAVDNRRDAGAEGFGKAGTQILVEEDVVEAVGELGGAGA